MTRGMSQAVPASLAIQHDPPLLRPTHRRPGGLDAPAARQLVCVDKAQYGRPSVLVHPISGDVACYLRLASALQWRRAIYGVAADGAVAGQLPLTSIEAMAERYIRHCLAYFDAIPDLLGGWSLGGLIAYEMARQCQARGLGQPDLVLIDSALPAGEALRMSREEILLAIARDIWSRAGARLDCDTSMFDGATDIADQVRLLREHAARNAPSLSPSVLRHLSKTLLTMNAHHIAMTTYKPPAPYVGRALVLRAIAHGDATNSRAFRRWGDLVGGVVVSRVVPGDHFSLMEAPNVTSVAREMDAYASGLDFEAWAAEVGASTC